MKTITINNIDHKISCNALTYIYHKKIFEKNIFSDINIIRDFLLLQINFNSLDEDNKSALIKKINSYLEAVSRLTYSAIFTRNKEIEDYKSWIDKNQILDQNSSCISTVIEDVIDCFIDEKVSEELEKLNECSGNDVEVLFPEHYFLSACLNLGLTLKDLEMLTYVDVLKIFLSRTKKKKQVRKATQADWDRLAGRS